MHPVGLQNATAFDFTWHMRRLCADIAGRVDDLRHIDVSRVAISFCQARKSTPYGVFASLTPLRFPGGGRQTVRRGQAWELPRLRDPDGREMLYILNFYLPRFLDLKTVDEKLLTVVHELWHIGPRFDGDTRRFRGRCHAHSGSQKKYEAQVESLLRRWLASEPPEPLCQFLALGFSELVARYGRVIGQKIPAPKLFRVGLPRQG
jgi:hypothetical protein